MAGNEGQPEAAPKTILIVEDEAIIAMAEARMLERLGYRVLTASSGEKAVHIAAQDGPLDLILMDIDLGQGMDGSEAAERILNRRTLPIVFLTSHAEKEVVGKVRGLTRYGYVLKESGDFVLQSSIEMAFELFQAHSALQASNERFRGAFHRSPILMSLTALDTGAVIDVNEEFARFTGYAREEMIGRTSLELGLWADPENRGGIIQRILRQGAAKGLDLEVRTRDGRIRQMLWSGEILVLSGREALLASGVDITERRIAEEALARSEANLQALIDNTPDIIVSRDLEDRVVVFNRAFADIVPKLFGVEAGPGLRTTDHLPPPARAHWQAILDRVRSGETHREEFDWFLDGQTRTYDLSLRPVRSGNRIIGTTESNHDITDIKRTEEDIRRLIAILSLAQEAGRAGTWDWNIREGTFFWSPEFKALFGLDPATEAGFEAWSQALHPEDRESAARRIQEAVDKRLDLINDYRIIHPDGSVRTIRAVGRTFYEDGAPLRMIGLCFDITALPGK